MYPMVQFSVPVPQGYNYLMPPSGGPTMAGYKPADQAMPVVSVYQDGYPQGLGPCVQPPAVDAGWASQTLAAMPGAINSPNTAYGMPQ